MDNATHAFAGLLLADATVEWIERRTGRPADRRLRRAAVGLGVIAAELPDADLLYSGPVTGLGNLGYLLHHRGHTHTLIFALASAMVMWWLVLWLRRRPAKGSAGNAVPDERERLPLLLLAVVGTLSHIALDYTNSYGVHPFWPLDNHWVYGDAVFIVEPWIWVIAIPALLFGPRRVWSRVLLSLLLLAILAAAWFLGQLTTTLAIAVTVGAALWLGVQRWIPARSRTAAALALWLGTELIFGASSARAVNAARAAVPAAEQLVDVVVSPGAANPFCFDALVITTTADTYRVRAATIAPWARGGADDAPSGTPCQARGSATRFAGIPGTVVQAPRVEGRITWSDEWLASRTDFTALARSRCEFAAALRFMRVPVWAQRGDTVMLSDLRFGVGTAGFSDVRIAPGSCTLSPGAWIPPWDPPRADVLRPE